MRDILIAQRNFKEDRRVLHEHNQDPLKLFPLFLEEVQEFQEALANNDRKEMGSELADIGLFLLTLCDVLGYDLEEEMRTKLARNVLKYPAHIYSNGYNYHEAKEIVKKQWKEQGGDERFYQEQY